MESSLIVPAVSNETQSYSSSQIHCAIKDQVAHIESLNLKSSDVLILGAKNRLQNAIAILSATHLGIKFYVTYERDELDPLSLFKEELQPVFLDYFAEPNAALSGDKENRKLGIGDFVAYMPSSGTSGSSKLVALDRENFIESARIHGLIPQHKDITSWLVPLPLSYMGGLAGLIRAAVLGYDLVLPETFNSRFIGRLFEEGLVTGASLVPTMLRKLLDEYDNFHFHKNVRSVLVGGSPIAFSLLKDLDKTLLDNHPLTITYGLTETCGQIAFSRQNGNTSDRINNLTFGDGVSSRLSNSKELQLKTIAISSSVLQGKEWFNTGDLAEMTESKFKVIGRKKLAVISGGKNINPQEIQERAEKCLPGMSIIALGLPDDKWGERLVLAGYTNQSYMGHEILERIRHEFVGHERPKDFYLCEEFPLLSSGKLDRVQLLNNIQSGLHVIERTPI